MTKTTQQLEQEYLTALREALRHRPPGYAAFRKFRSPTPVEEATQDISSKAHARLRLRYDEETANELDAATPEPSAAKFREKFAQMLRELDSFTSEQRRAALLAFGTMDRLERERGK